MRAMPSILCAGWGRSIGTLAARVAGFHFCHLALCFGVGFFGGGFLLFEHKKTIGSGVRNDGSWRAGYLRLVGANGGQGKAGRFGLDASTAAVHALTSPLTFGCGLVFSICGGGGVVKRSVGLLHGGVIGNQFI